MRHARVSLAAVAALATLLSSCHGASSPRGSNEVMLSAVPQAAPMDQQVTIRLTGLAAQQRVELTATATDYAGDRWSSHASFRASSDGVVDPAVQRPLGGSSYDVVDGMGLLEFLTPAKPAEAFIAPADGYPIRLTALVGTRQIAATTIRRETPQTLGVREQRYRPRGSGIYADLFLPRSHARRRTAVIVFGGSEGGLATAFSAQLLASHGYPAIALAYFKEPGLHQTLTRIPLEYFHQAMRILERRSGISGRHIVSWGTSRGSEAALLLGVHYPAMVQGVIAGSPSSVANPAYPSEHGASWTFRGKGVPTVPSGQYEDPDPADRAAEIPVERIHGPILAICGTADDIWPSCGYSHAMVSRLHRRHSPYPPELVSFPGAGHFVADALPFVSQVGIGAGVDGGSLVADRLGQDKSWQDILAFLNRLG